MSKRRCRQGSEEGKRTRYGKGGFFLAAQRKPHPRISRPRCRSSWLGPEPASANPLCSSSSSGVRTISNTWQSLRCLGRKTCRDEHPFGGRAMARYRVHAGQGDRGRNLYPTVRRFRTTSNFFGAGYSGHRTRTRGRRASLDELLKGPGLDPMPRIGPCGQALGGMTGRKVKGPWLLN